MAKNSVHSRVLIAISLAMPVLALPPGIRFSVAAFDYPGNDNFREGVSAIATDRFGNIYVAGSTTSDSLPTTPGVFQRARAQGTCEYPGSSHATYPCDDTFVARLDPSGKLVFLTYLGGAGEDLPQSIAIDRAGNIYVAGTTTSTDFPQRGAAWSTEGSGAQKGFLAKLSENGTVLLYSTLISSRVGPVGIGPADELFGLVHSGESDTVVAKLAPSGALLASASVPGAWSIAVDAAGSVYAAGWAGSDQVTASAHAWQPSYGGGDHDGYVAKLDQTLARVVWLTWIGGTGDESAGDIAVNEAGEAWVAGVTQSSDFRVNPDAWQKEFVMPGPVFPGIPASRGFLVHLSADGSKALASTFTPDGPVGLAPRQDGGIVISGSEGAAFVPTPGSPYPCQQPEFRREYLARIDRLGRQMLWGTLLGPSIPSGPAAVDASGNLLTAGVVHQGSNWRILLASLSTGPGSPRLEANCIAQAAYPYLPAAIVPGELVSIYGAGFGPVEPVSAAYWPNHKIGTNLGGVQVLVNDVPAPLLYVSADQVNFAVPYALAGRTSARVRVVTAEASSNDVTLATKPSLPQIFELTQLRALALNGDGRTVNDASHPAHPGEVVTIFASGAGTMTPAASDGEIPQTGTRHPVLPVSVHLSWQRNYDPPQEADAEITYAGEAPGLVSGVLQVTFRIPDVASIRGTGDGPNVVGVKLKIDKDSVDSAILVQ